MSQRRRTPGYYIFYVLFLPDTWQILIGLMVSYLLTPVILPPEMSGAGVAVLYIMIATIGYAASRKPALGFTRRLKKWILGDRIP